MEQQVTKIEYAVGLSREEYVRSQELVNTVFRKRYLSRSRWFAVFMLVLCLLMAAADYRVSGTVDVSLAVIVTLMSVAELWMLLDLPRQWRRQTETMYDVTLFSGHSFDGVLSVDADGITKTTGDETTRINFDRCLALIEAEDMLLFCVEQGKSIIVPARCLTEQAAQQTKQAAQNRVEPSKQYLLSPIRPSNEHPAPVVPMASPASEEPILTITMDITSGEFKADLTDTVIRDFFNKFSGKMLTAVTFTIIFYFVWNTMPLPMFLLSLLVLFVGDVVRVRFRARRAIALSDGDVCRATVNFTEQYVGITRKAKESRRLQIPWYRITRAIERPQQVEFYVGRSRMLTIPKRCIENMEQLRHLVDAHMA